MARYNLTFNLKSTSTDDLVRAVTAALGGDMQPTRDVGGSVEEVLPWSCPAEIGAGVGAISDEGNLPPDDQQPPITGAS